MWLLPFSSSKPTVWAQNAVALYFEPLQWIREFGRAVKQQFLLMRALRHAKARLHHSRQFSAARMLWISSAYDDVFTLQNVKSVWPASAVEDLSKWKAVFYANELASRRHDLLRAIYSDDERFCKVEVPASPPSEIKQRESQAGEVYATLSEMLRIIERLESLGVEVDVVRDQLIVATRQKFVQDFHSSRVMQHVKNRPASNEG